MSLSGLTTAEVVERRRRGLVNRVPARGRAEYAEIVRRNLVTWFNALVVPAAIALFLLGEWRGAVAVSGMMFVNSVLGLAQEIHAKRRLDKLTLVAATRVRVWRDGLLQEIPADEVVQGDAIRLAVGELIVADGPVLEARSLEVDEALLTGESDPVPRRPGDPLLAGSYCVAGEGAYRAELVGIAAFAQATAREARQYRYAAGPIQHGINKVVRLLSYTAIGLSAGYLLLYLLGRFPAEELARMVAATVTSMVPQGLVLTATLAFTLGAIRLALRGAVVQRLNAVEAMAAVDVLCLDKTGTLTTNRLTLERVLPLGIREGGEEVPSTQYPARSAMSGLSTEYWVLGTVEIPPELAHSLRLFVSAAVDRTNKNLQALRTALGETAVDVLEELPFKSQNRYSAVRLYDCGQERVLVLGAVEVLLGQLALGAAEVECAWRERLPTGLRLLLFAEAVELLPLARFAETKLRPLGLIALRDELRPEAAAVLEALAAQGVALKILSGDNPETVRATLSGLKLALAAEPVVSGDELAAAADPAALVRSHSVFGRVAPRQKLEIVSLLQQMGHFVAMLGDGVNDVLPIRRADLGLAMGEGSTAAKTVAGLVLQTNDFGLLPAALAEGRTVVRNLRRSGKLFLVKNVYTLVLIALAAGILGLAFPYLPQQVTLLNALTIGFPAILITLSRGHAAAADRRRFWHDVGSFVLRTGLVIGTAGLAVLAWSADVRGDSLPTQRSLLLAVLVLLGMQTLVRVLRDGEVEPPASDKALYALAALALPGLMVALYWRPVARFFELMPLTIRDWVVVLAVALPALVLAQLFDRWTSGRKRRAPRP